MSLQPELSEYKHLFFDMDGTLTRSRTQVTPEMRDALNALPHDILVISGQSSEAIARQLEGVECFIMGQNGNQVFEGETELWNDLLSDDEKAAVLQHIESLPRDWEVPDEYDLIEDRGCQITYSLYGMHAPVEDKERFDPDQSLRKRLLAEHPLESETIEVKIAGTTGLDYFKKGRNKGYNIARLIGHKSWDKAECCYFGDMLFPGGNDESVIGVIDTVEVESPTDTLAHLVGDR